MITFTSILSWIMIIITALRIFSIFNKRKNEEQIEMINLFREQNIGALIGSTIVIGLLGVIFYGFFFISSAIIIGNKLAMYYSAFTITFSVYKIFRDVELIKNNNFRIFMRDKVVVVLNLIYVGLFIFNYSI